MEYLNSPYIVEIYFVNFSLNLNNFRSYYGLNVCPPEIYVEALTPKETVCGGGAFEK